MNTALAVLILLATPPTAAEGVLPVGRYAGQAPGGRVDLALFDDGRAIFGGAALRWTLADGALSLRAPGGRMIVLSVRHDAEGAVLDGSVFGPIRITPLPDIDPVRAPAPVRPMDWIGAWRRDAPGGALVLRLIGDGRYEMQQAGADDRPTIDRGRWQAIGGALVLTPTGGAPLSYSARRDGAELMIGGGDLPIEVRFAADQPR